MLLAGIYAPPIEQLKGSVFPDFKVPGLSLILLVGGSAVVSAVLLLKRSRFALPSTMLAGLVIMSFEFVEVLAIGSPAGAPRIMQIVYFTIGALLVSSSLVLLFVDAQAARGQFASE